jgi:hypothetical protein
VRGAPSQQTAPLGRRKAQKAKQKEREAEAQARQAAAAQQQQPGSVGWQRLLQLRLRLLAASVSKIIPRQNKARAQDTRSPHAVTVTTPTA